MGAPEKISLNAAGRPIRQAAAKSKYSRVYNVSSEFEVKPPWLQEDQDPEDEDETWLPFMVRPAPVGRPAPEAPVNVAAGPAPGQAAPDQGEQEQDADPEQVPRQRDEAPDLDQVPGQLLQAEAEVDQPGSEANSSTDGSEYYNISINRAVINQEEEYDWDEHEEALSFTTSEAEPGPPILPPGWPPRRLSSECSNQMIVTQLAPTSSDYDTYFEDTAFENNGMLASSSVTPNQQTDKNPQLLGNLPVVEVTAESEDQISGSDTEFHPTDVSDPGEVAEAILPSQEQEQSDTAHQGQRQSSRIQNIARPDYKSLHSKGRPSNL